MEDVKHPINIIIAMSCCFYMGVQWEIYYEFFKSLII